MLAPYSSRLSNMKVVLASTSPRRQQILQEQLGLQFEVVDPCFNEDLTPIDILAPGEYVEENAMQKALSVAKDYIFSEMEVPLLIIGADTIVVMNNDILGKPDSLAHNVAMLKREVGHDLPPLYQGYQMIRSLPDDFRTTVQAIYRWSNKDFVPDKIEAELLLEENRLGVVKKDLEDVSTFAFSD
ncbi:uncharacterized protein TNCT_640741 [Trichonephila clavata]|uniref:Maf-like protein n=1 Tax=Trichonephila clavata TaxID=2740835 RepID=A0A8X6IYJ6_TRICU|nr:uncharacterized protein TNCT_640741 [Trichonephila clavata]